MSGRGTRIVAGLVGLVVIIGASVAIVARDPPRPQEITRPQNRPAPPTSTEEGSTPFQDQLSLVECIEPARSPPSLAQEAAATAREEIDRIARAVEELRDLRFKRDFDVDFHSPQGVARRAVRLSLEEYPPRVARAEAAILAALGAIPRGTNLRHLVGDLLESQVAGFYLPEKATLVVPGTPGEPLSAFDRTILAHELEHAVADQNLDLPLDDPDPRDLDENQAMLSVVEGDATLTMQQYATVAVSALDQLGMLGDPRLAQARQSLADIPHYLIQELSFPYETGLKFVCHLYSNGGWKAVNRAYRNPPVSSAQVMFPNRYRSGKLPVDPKDPKEPPGFDEVFAATFGAANLLWLFEAPGGDTGAALDDADARVAAWAGGEVHLFKGGGGTAVALLLVRRKGAGDLCASIGRWYDASFPDDSPAMPKGGDLLFEGRSQNAVLACRGNAVRLGIGPTPESAERISRAG
jgi:hypothetical protein